MSKRDWVFRGSSAGLLRRSFLLMSKLKLCMLPDSGGFLWVLNRDPRAFLRISINARHGRKILNVSRLHGGMGLKLRRSYHSDIQANLSKPSPIHTTGFLRVVPMISTFRSSPLIQVHHIMTLLYHTERRRVYGCTHTIRREIIFSVTILITRLSPITIKASRVNTTPMFILIICRLGSW